jgi:hypothetical protein
MTDIGDFKVKNQKSWILNSYQLKVFEKKNHIIKAK